MEFYCGDATTTSRRWQLGLGMAPVAKSDLSTGNARFASYCLQSGSLRFVFTAPYAAASEAAGAGAGLEGEAGPPPEAQAAVAAAAAAEGGEAVHPGFDAAHAAAFFRRHGVAARAIGAWGFGNALFWGGERGMDVTRAPEIPINPTDPLK